MSIDSDQIKFRKKFLHEPSYFQFGVGDLSQTDEKSPIVAGDEIFNQRISVSLHSVSIGVISDYGKIPIEAVHYESEPSITDFSEWDRIVECAIGIVGQRISLTSCVGEEFGRITVQPGRYRIRVFYGGQDTDHGDGTADDHYLIQIWPSEDASTKIIKS